MYTIYYNFETKAHSIINNELQLPIDKDDVVVHEGTLMECKAYLEPLNIIFQVVDVPQFDGAGFTEEDNYKDVIPTESEGIE